jgi:hypothetical protein
MMKMTVTKLSCFLLRISNAHCCERSAGVIWFFRRDSRSVARFGVHCHKINDRVKVHSFTHSFSHRFAWAQKNRQTRLSMVVQRPCRCCQ